MSDETQVPEPCKRCREPMYLHNDRCRNCGIHVNTPVAGVPRWLRRLAEKGFVKPHV